MAQVRLETVLEGVSHRVIRGGIDIPVSMLTVSSGEVRPGGMFIAVRGTKVDGHKFIYDALKNGAAAVMCDEGYMPPDDGRAVNGNPPATFVTVPDTRKVIAATAANFFGRPADKLRVIGVTGTNGKTTVSYLIQSVLQAAGRNAGRFGTINYDLGRGVLKPAPLTTPEPVELQRLFAELVQAGTEYCVMEVSSHSLALDRVAGVRFCSAVFTNLTRDHLDFHKDMEEYYAAKRKLFASFPIENAIINTDDPYGARLAAESAFAPVSYGIDSKAVVTATGISTTLQGSKFTLNSPYGSFIAESPLPGRHNIYNILAAVAAGLAENIPMDKLRDGIASLGSVPGRMENVAMNAQSGFDVIVDYAHTDDALKNVISALREVTSGRIITVFGCGGDRDKAKRPLMGKAAYDLSDEVVITSDNPRTEDPYSIIEDILEGIPHHEKSADEKGKTVIVDRAEAIRFAIDRARQGDCVLIAGKGHEDYQILGTKKIHFDDREVASAAIDSILRSRI